MNHDMTSNNLIASHGTFLTPEEDAKICDMVDAAQQDV